MRKTLRMTMFATAATAVLASAGKRPGEPFALQRSDTGLLE